MKSQKIILSIAMGLLISPAFAEATNPTKVKCNFTPTKINDLFKKNDSPTQIAALSQQEMKDTEGHSIPGEPRLELQEEALAMVSTAI